MEHIEATPEARAPSLLDRAAPADQGFAVALVDDEVFGVKADSPEISVLMFQLL